jgi:aryl-alcohol dehydrogenase-like predicted oxidoreductase
MIGAGCWPLGGPCVNGRIDVGWSPVDEDGARTALDAARQAGISLFDTADVYGRGLSEKRLGQMLAEATREQLVISSKVGYYARDGYTHPYQPELMSQQLDQTLTNLRTDYLDIYALHSGDFGPEDRYLPSAIEHLRKARDCGRIRAISMRAPHEFTVERASLETAVGRKANRFLQLFRQIEPDIISVRHNMLGPRYGEDETDIFSFAVQENVGVLLKQVLGQGLLTGRHDPHSPPTFVLGDHRRRKEWFTKPGLEIFAEELQALRERFGARPEDLVRVAVRYALQTAPSAVALVGTHTSSQIISVTNGLGSPLSSADVSYVQSIGLRIRTRLISQFGPDSE